MKKIYFVGDAHFGAQNENLEKEKTDLFLSFLDLVIEQDAELVICGDLFDFWFEYRQVIPRLYYRVLSKLSGMTSAGKKIHYVAGNHDFWLGSFMENEIGLQIHPDEFMDNLNGNSVYMRHGDGLLREDYLYRLMKKILRNPVNIFLYRLLHPDIGISLALFFAHLSRNSKDRAKYSDREYREFAYQKIDDGYKLVVLGHTHWPALDKYKTGWYLNPGDWMHSFTYGVFDGIMPQLLKWDGRNGHEVDIQLPPGDL